MFKSKVTLACVLLTLLVLGTLYFFSPNYGYHVIEREHDNTITNYTHSDVFEPVLPNDKVTLPSAYQAQREFKHGIWHFFANVVDHSGKKFGIQWSFYRIGQAESVIHGWSNSELYIAYIVISDNNKVWKQQRIARGGIGQAGILNNPFRLWVDNWQWNSTGHAPLPGVLSVATDDFSIRLSTVKSGPIIISGEAGYVKKHDLLPMASKRITAPFLDVEGEMQLGQGTNISFSGSGWMSKEWGNQVVPERNQQGLNLAFNLDNGSNLFIERYHPKGQSEFLTGQLVRKDGTSIVLKAKDIKLSSLEDTSNGGLPLAWSLSLPKYDIELKTQVLNTKLWLPFTLPYWEGAIYATGTHTASGFMQLTGFE